MQGSKRQEGNQRYQDHGQPESTKQEEVDVDDTDRQCNFWPKGSLGNTILL